MTILALLAASVLQAAKVEVAFTYESASAKTVHLAGSFNNWSTTETPMERRPGTNTWSRTLSLPTGKYWYKFVLDGATWVTDPRAQRQEDDGNGNTNSVVLALPPGYETPAARNDGATTQGAIRHEFTTRYANLDGGEASLKIEARAGDLESVTLVLDGKEVPMRIAGADDFTEWYSATFPVKPGARSNYYFKIVDGPAWTLGESGLKRGATPGDNYSVVWEPSLFPSTPNWVQDSVFYQIFPDRFANGDTSNDPEGTVAWDASPTWFNWFGGDLAGVRQHLGYLTSLGVSGVYFNPIFEGPSNHRYETTDYDAVDHRLGTNAEFRTLVRDLHRKRVKVVLDGVFNHTSVAYPAFADLLARQQESPFRDWYEVTSFPVSVRDQPPYKAWFGFKSMPELNFDNPKVRKAVLDVVDFWDNEAAIDGWRLDVANEVPHEFWREFRSRVKSHSQDRWIVGEIWGDGTPWLGGDQFDSVMNYRFREAVLGFAARGSLTPSAFMARLLSVWNAHPPQISRNMMNLLGSHDTPRLLHECGEDARKARFAAMLQFAWPGAPSIYYGDEIGMSGGPDPENRRGMEWDLATDENPFLSLYRRLIVARKSSLALRRGAPVLVSTDDELGTIVFRRSYQGETVVVLVNASEAPRAMRASGLGEGPLVDLFGTASPELAGTQVRATVPPLSVCVLSTKARSTLRGPSGRSDQGGAPFPTEKE
ncbi:MAG: alpha-glycosidase [Fimbriimonadaceae bacterium]|nr:alpha-glycosidase [Fimbriimonadaceae bacterium]